MVSTRPSTTIKTAISKQSKNGWLTEEIKKEIENLEEEKKKLLASKSPTEAMQELKVLIFQAAYDLSVECIKDLKKGRGKKKDQTYGETLIKQLLLIFEEIKLTDEHTFLDMGSGIGQVCCAAAGFTNIKKTIGIEYVEGPAEIAVNLMQRFGFKIRPVELYRGDFFEDRFARIITEEANVIFINNLVFESETNVKIETLLENCRPGTKIISTREIIGDRFYREGMSQRRAFARLTKVPVPLTSIEDGVSWTNTKVKFYYTEFR